MKSLLPTFFLSLSPFVAACGGAATNGLFDDVGVDSGTDAATCCPTCSCVGPTPDAGAGGDAGTGSDTGSGADTGPPVQFICGDPKADAYLVCNPDTQYCEKITSPHHASPSYSCWAVPAACSSDVSCDCLMSNLSASGCEEANGQVTILEAAP